MSCCILLIPQCNQNDNLTKVMMKIFNAEDVPVLMRLVGLLNIDAGGKEKGRWVDYSNPQSKQALVALKKRPSSKRYANN